MKIKKRTSLIASMLSLIILASGCVGDSIITNEEQIDIEVIVKNKEAPFWSVVEMGAVAAGKELGVNIHFDGPTDEKAIEVQISMVRKAIESKADAIVLAACDYERLVHITHKAITEKIPVITIDSGLNSERVKSFIGTDNVEAGKKLGQALVDKVGESCEIAVMSFVKEAASCYEREEGLFETLSMYDDVQVLDVVYCNSDIDIAEKLTVELIEKYPDIDAIVGLNAYGTTGAARAIIKEKKANIIKIIGFDSTPEEIRYVEKDIIQSLVVQNPFSMGYLGVKYAYDSIKNERIPKIVDTGLTVIDKDNMYYTENQKLVFPFSDGQD
ncbi:MAG: ABC transporter substrate-binding protein [Clostridiaceae bacterium]|nr:ABC transporter substrate-binding protein [Clostridiaceae bacterium]